MITSTEQPEAVVFSLEPAKIGNRMVYRQNETNHCPGCGHTHWYIGRFSAECAFCETAMPLAQTAMVGSGTHSRNHREVELAA